MRAADKLMVSNAISAAGRAVNYGVRLGVAAMLRDFGYSTAEALRIAALVTSGDRPVPDTFDDLLAVIALEVQGDPPSNMTDANRIEVERLAQP